jgi:hypothetical protein
MKDVNSGTAFQAVRNRCRPYRTEATAKNGPALSGVEGGAKVDAKKKTQSHLSFVIGHLRGACDQTGALRMTIDE